MPSSNLTTEETLYWKRIEPIVCQLLDELKSGDWIRNETEFHHNSFGQLLQITERINAHGLTMNYLTEALTRDQQLTDFLVKLGLGFTQENVSTTWIYDVFSVFTESTEMMRQYLLVILRWNPPFTGKMTLGRLMNALKRKSPTYGPAFVAEVDVELRNAMAHARFWFSKNTLASPLDLNYCAELGRVPKRESVSDVIARMKKQNLLANCVAEVLGSRATSGWFR